jgi:hypothetical protein
MNRLIITLSCTAALLGLTCHGSAQQPGPAGGVQTPAVKAKVGRKEANKARVAKLDTEEKKAYKAVSGAIKLVEHALPIYDGHRVLALDLLKTSRTDMVVGANNEAVPAKKGKKAKKNAVPEGHDKSKYTPAQVATSQKELEQAVQIIGKAIDDLAAKTDSYNMESVSNLRKAQDELKAAIALHATA